MPGWITFNALTNTLNASPTRTELAGAKIELVANDGNGGTVSEIFELNVSPVNNAAVGSVELEGKRSINEMITAKATISDNDGLGTFTYQWFSNGVKVQNPTSNNYKILGSDLGKNIKVVVKYSDGFGFSETVSSDEIKIDFPVQTIENTATYGRNVFKERT